MIDPTPSRVRYLARLARECDRHWDANDDCAGCYHEDPKGGGACKYIQIIDPDLHLEIKTDLAEYYRRKASDE